MKAKRTIREETEAMKIAADWEGATIDNVVALYEIVHHEIYGIYPDDHVVARQKATALLEEHVPDVDTLIELMRWALTKAKRDARAGKDFRMGAGLLFSLKTLTDYKLYLARKGEYVETDEPETDADEPTWTKKLERKPSGSLKANISNIATILVHDEQWAGVLAFDEFVGDIVTTREPPWDEDMKPADMKTGDWRDDDAPRTCMWFSRHYGIDVRPGLVNEAITIAARRHVVHPVQDHLRSLAWDGEARIDNWLVQICGADDTDYTRAISAKFLISAVARAMKPGCKVDTMLVLEGKQGVKKSTLARVLGTEAWTLEMAPEMGTKDGYQVLRHKWIVEVPELEAMSKAETSKAKAFIAQQIDTYRPSYGRASCNFPRQCVFIGTTNASAYLKDETGGRRFWPVKIRTIDIEKLTAIRDQLFAEAFVRFERGEIWHVDDAELQKDFESEQALRYQEDAWQGPIERWLNDRSTKDAKERTAGRRRDGVTTADVLHGALKLSMSTWTRAETMRVAAVLNLAGWEAGEQSRRQGERVRLYRPAAATAVTGRDGRDDVVTATTRKLGASNGVSQPSQPNNKKFGGGDLEGGDSSHEVSEIGCDVVTGKGLPKRSTANVIKFARPAKAGGA